MRRFKQLAIAVATIGGLGRIPVAPGTAGSAVGLAIGIVLARTLSWPIALSILVATFVACALTCTMAEREIGQHDPSAVILDEVWAMAAIIVVLPWVAVSGFLLLLAFLCFRFFDIAKPPPLKRLATLPRGWGIIADDLGAAAYTAAILWIASRAFG